MDAIREFLRNADQIEHGMITLDEYERMNEILRDVEPVIRCKDCKHYEMASNEANGWCEANDCPFAPWDYCSYGERKEE